VCGLCVCVCVCAASVSECASVCGRGVTLSPSRPLERAVRTTRCVSAVSRVRRQRFLPCRVGARSLGARPTHQRAEQREKEERGRCSRRGACARACVCERGHSVPHSRAARARSMLRVIRQRALPCRVGARSLVPGQHTSAQSSERRKREGGVHGEVSVARVRV